VGKSPDAQDPDAQEVPPSIPTGARVSHLGRQLQRRSHDSDQLAVLDDREAAELEVFAMDEPLSKDDADGGAQWHD
jgi:hypothetical protein